MRFNIRKMTTNFLCIFAIFAINFNNLIANDDVYQQNINATYNELIYESCVCHKATEFELIRKNSGEGSIPDSITQDINQVYSACKEDVAKSMEGVLQSKNVELLSYVGRGLFNQLRQLSINSIAQNKRTIKLTNSQLNTNSTCNEALNTNYQQLADQIDSSGNESLTECFNLIEMERRRDCLFRNRQSDLIKSFEYVVIADPVEQDKEELQEKPTQEFVVSGFVNQELERQRQLIQQTVDRFCSCSYVKTTAQVIECVKIVRDNAPDAQDASALASNEKMEKYLGTLVCNSSSAKEELGDDYLLSCLEGTKSKSACRDALETRLNNLYCFNKEKEPNCLSGLKDVVLSYNHRKVVTPCQEGNRPSDLTVIECEDIAAYQFLLNSNSANFIKYLCPVNWDQCEESTTAQGEAKNQYCRSKKEHSDCKEKVVGTMLRLGEQAYANYSIAGALRGLTAEKLATSKNPEEPNDCDVTTTNYWSPKTGSTRFKTDKSNDACLLQKFVVDNNMNHIDQEIISMCALEQKEKSVPNLSSLNSEQKSSLLARDLTSAEAKAAVECYYQKNIKIDDQALMAELEGKYCKAELYSSALCTPEKWNSDANSCKKECMNRLLSRSFAAVDPECMEAHKDDPIARKICSIRSKLNSLASNNFPVTSCFNEQAFPNREQRNQCMNTVKDLEKRMSDCLETSKPLECINTLLDDEKLAQFHDANCSEDAQKQGQCFSILNEYVNSMLAWQQPSLIDTASVGTCVAEGYQNSPRGILECRMMKLSQYGYNNRNAYIDRNFYCQTGEVPAESAQCNAFSVPYVPESPTDGLALLNDVGSTSTIPGPQPAPGQGDQTVPSAAPIASVVAVTGAGAITSNPSAELNDISRGITVDGKPVSMKSSLLSGAKGDGFFGFIKDFKYLRFMGKKHPPACRAIGRAALMRVLGTVGGALTVYLVHKKVMEKYKEKKENELNDGSDPNNTALRNEQNVQIKAMDHIKQGYKGVLAGLGVKIAFNLLARGITQPAIAAEQLRVSQGQPATVCKSDGGYTNSSILPTNTTDSNVNDPEENAYIDIIVPNDKTEEYFVSQLESKETVPELQIAFEEYSAVTMGTKNRSMTVSEYESKKFQYMLEEINFEDEEIGHIDILRSGFISLVQTTSDLILPKVHAMGGDSSQIISFGMMILPQLLKGGNNKSQDTDNSKESNGRDTAQTNAVTADDTCLATVCLQDGDQTAANNVTTDTKIQGDTESRLAAFDAYTKNEFGGSTSLEGSSEEPETPDIGAQ